MDKVKPFRVKNDQEEVKKAIKEITDELSTKLKDLVEKHNISFVFGITNGGSQYEFYTAVYGDLPEMSLLEKAINLQVNSKFLETMTRK